MTNSGKIAKRLQKRGSGDHRHVVLVGGRAKRAEIYPEELCREIIYSFTDQMLVDGRVGSNRVKLLLCEGIGIRDQIEGGSEEILDFQSWDDVSGKP